MHARIENDQTVFHVGELIRLELSYSANATGFEVSTATNDRSGRLGIERYAVEPQTGWDDPLKSYYSHGAFLGGGLSSAQLLSSEPYIVHRDLNEWVRFNQPGRYRIVVLSTRAGPAGYGFDNPNPELRSNELAITIIPATPEWQSATLAGAVAILKRYKASANPDARDEQRKRAVATLRYLGTAAAAEEMARHLDDPEQFQFMLGLIASPARDAAITALERVLNDPLAPITSTLINTLERLSAGDISKDPPYAWRDRYALILDKLIAALGEKRGAAQAISAFTVAQETTNFSGLSLSEAQKVRLSRYLVAGFDLLPARSQSELLEIRWAALDPQVMLALLPKIAARYRDGPVLNESNLWEANNASAAARHWWEVDPTAARAAILTEILRPRPRFGADAIGMLPEKELPEADAALADHLFIEGGHDNIVASLIARYATSGIEPQVTGFLEERIGKWRCDTQASLLAYLLRVDPQSAKPLLERALAARSETGCYRMLLIDIAQTYNDPVLEEAALKALQDEDAEVVSNAALYLGAYGSAAAETALWARLDLWALSHPHTSANSTFPDQNADKDATDALMRAIATGRAWLADEAKLHRLVSYASTGTLSRSFRAPRLLLTSLWMSRGNR